MYRLKKEHQTYITEAEAQKRKLDKLVADGVEGWDIRNNVRRFHSYISILSHSSLYEIKTRIMEESDKMVIDSSSRLEKAVEELSDLIVRSFFCHSPEFFFLCLAFGSIEIGKEGDCAC
jgi:tubulin-specific chaperone A